MKKTITLFAAGVFLACSTRAQLPNAGMETWRNYTVGGVAMEAPTGWYGFDSVLNTIANPFDGQRQIYQSTDVHAGNAAACLVSKAYSATLGVLPGLLTNAKISVYLQSLNNYTVSGGTPITQRVANATAWLKYLPKGNDSATFDVAAVIAGIGVGGGDSVIGRGTKKITSTAGGYMQVTVPITYINATQVPTHLQVIFASSPVHGLVTSGTDSSVLVIDDAAITLPSGVSQSLFNAKVVHVFPNPAVHTLFINTKSEDLLQFEIIAPNGQLISGKSFTKETSISLNELAAGMYFFRISNKNYEVIQTGKFMVE